MDPELAIEAMRTAARALVAGDPRERVRAIQTAQDALDAAKADALAQIESMKAYEIDGASTLNTWVRNELRMTAADAHTLVRAAATFAALPLVAEAATAGRIRADHVKAFTYGLKHIGHDIMTRYEEALVVIAENKDPVELLVAMRKLRAAVFPDDLDQAYLNGQDKEDIQVSAVLEGWHVTGFLNADGEAQGRPVGVTLDQRGALLVADDVGNKVWRVTPAKPAQ